jgi:hypothetical protein
MFNRNDAYEFFSLVTGLDRSNKKRRDNAKCEAEHRSFHIRIRGLIKLPLQSRRRCMALQ